MPTPRQALTFRVTHGDFSVTIVHPSVHTLEDLAESIIRSVYFDMDHCFGFYSNLKNISPSEEEYTLFADIGEEVSEHDLGVKTTLLTSVFKPKKQMLFLFDYGEDWRFLVTCESIEETESMFRKPKILNPSGNPPEQYPDYEEE
jgi:Plasmid pRiA4b ORF-3-like protein